MGSMSKKRFPPGARSRGSASVFGQSSSAPAPGEALCLFGLEWRAGGGSASAFGARLFEGSASFLAGREVEALRSPKVVLNKALGRWKSGSASLFEIRRALPAGQKDFPTAEKEGSASIGRREEALRWFWNHRWPQPESLFKAKAGSASAKLEGGSASSWEKRFSGG